MQAVQDALSTEIARAQTAPRGSLRTYLELTKPGITLFIMFSAATGYLLAPAHEPGSWLRFLITVLGIGLTSGGAATLNQYMERERDRLMMRTKRRSLPSGRVSANHALAIGLGLSVFGVLLLVLFVGMWPAVLAALSLLIYLFVYTPLKTRTVWCTAIGGIPGALPIVAGWTARGSVTDAGAWALFSILFMWQIPHFYALAWLYREDYERGGFKMLTHYDPTGLLTHRVSLFTALLLAVCTALPAWTNVAGLAYAFLSMVLAAVFVGAVSAMRADRMEVGARRVFLLSLLYLPAVYGLLILDLALRG